MSRVEHKSDDTDSDEDLVLHASVSEPGSLLDRRNTNLKKKPVSTHFADVIDHDREINLESKTKPKLKDKSKGKKTRGEVLTPEAALDFMIKERQDFDFQCAALRAENDSLREGLDKYQHLSTPAITERVVIKTVLDPDGEKYKQDAEQLSSENEMLKRRHMEMEALLEQQRQLAEEAQRHPISRRKNTPNHTKEEEESPETILSAELLPIHVREDGQRHPETKKKSEKKSSKKSSSKREAIQRSLVPVSASNCTTFPMLLWKGGILWKIPFNGRGVPERRLVMIKRAPLPGKKAKPVQLFGHASADGSTSHSSVDTFIVNPPTIIWANPDKPSDLKTARELVLYEGAHIVLGHQSPAFWKSKSRGTHLPPEEFCFSIITNSRSLDLAAESIEEVVAWKNALHMLLVLMSPNQEWAIENLVKRQPVWHHEELENHANQKRKTRKEKEIVTIGDESARLRDEEYENATNASKEVSLKDQMFAAVRSADVARLENILKTRISVNLMETTKEDSDTVLMIACRAGLDKITRLCLDYGARNDPHPDVGQTALHCAVEAGSHKCARVLLEVAAQSQADHIIANLRDSGDQTPLHVSADFGDTKMCTILVSHGADIASVDSKRRNPLHLCAGSGHKICLSLLLDSGGDLYLDRGDGQGNTPLHYSAENGHLTCCRLMLETAANPLARNVYQQTPYNLASLRGHQKICALLLDYQDSVARSTQISQPTGPQRSSSLTQLTSPEPIKIERHASVPVFMPGSSPIVNNRSPQIQLLSPYGGGGGGSGAECALPRPYSARASSNSGNGAGGGRLDSPVPQQYPFTSRDVTHTSSSMMADLNSPVMNHPHSARDRTTTLFQGLSVNAGHLNQKHNSIFGQGSNAEVQDNLHKNLFKQSRAVASMDNIPQSPVSTPGRKHIVKNQHHHSPLNSEHQHYEVDACSFDASGAEVDLHAPYEEFELFDTLWQVYWTEEGYAYYLDSLTQHSQWDDPRTHGLLQYDEITGEVIPQPNSSASIVGDESDFQDFDTADQVQDAFLQPKLLEAKQDSSSQKRSLPKRVQSSKPQKFTANIADMSPFRTTGEEDSESDSEGGRFSAPARGSRTQQLQDRRGISLKKAFGTPEEVDRNICGSGDDESDDDVDLVPRLGSRLRKGSRQERQRLGQGVLAGGKRSDSGSSDSSSGQSDKEESVGDSDFHSDDNDEDDSPFNKSLHRDGSGARARRTDLNEEQDSRDFVPVLHNKSAPNGPRKIPYLSDADMAAYDARRSVEDKELKRGDGGRGTWFDSAGEGVDNESELALGKTVSRMVRQPHRGAEPAKTNCFSPDKESLKRAEQLQRNLSNVSSRRSSPARSCSSSSTSEDDKRKDSRKNKNKSRNKNKNSSAHNDGLQNVRFVPDTDEVLVGNMQLDSDKDDEDDDFFDTIITMKKDELASTETDTSDIKSANNASYMQFLSKIESDAKRTSAVPESELSLAVDIDHDSDWDEEQEKQKQLKEMASAEKEKQMKIFDTSKEGGYGNGGHTLFVDEADCTTDTEPTVNDQAEDILSSKLHVITEPPPGEDLLRSLQPSDSPFVKSVLGSPSLEARLQPYIGFLEAGNSVRQVRRQMEKDNQPKELIKLMIQKSDDVSCTPSSSSSVSSSCALSESVTDLIPRKATPEELSDMKRDPSIGKYIKMAAMGVPFGNVEHKMKSEGVQQEDILRVAYALGHGPALPPVQVTASASSTSGSGIATGNSRPSSVRRSSNVSLVKMHWNTLPPDKLENSIWANNDEDSMGEKEMQELEKLFAASGNVSNAGSSGGAVAASASVAPSDLRLKLFVLDSRRAQNIVIGLSQFKGYKSHQELLEAVCRLDDLDGSLNIDKLQNLVPLLPTLHEAKKMEAAQDSQHPAEVFFNAAIVYYPDLLKRLNCFLTCLTFADTSEILLSKMRRIIEACNEVISSDSLARILQKMLTVGNLMNEGTYRGQASGFTLDSLLKMVHTKGVDKKTTVLDYVIKSLLERGEDRLLGLSDTLEVDEETTRLSGRDASREIDHLFKDFQELEDEFQNASNNSVESKAVVEFTMDFTEKLSVFLEYGGEKVSEVKKTHDLMKRKIVAVVEYFGEDVHTCETTKIFSVIRQFIMAFESSKIALIERRNRKQRK